MAPALELGDDDLVDVEEAVFLESDLDERGLHPRQDVVDGALVDVAGDRAPLGALEVDLGNLVVLEYGDPLLADVDRDEQLALRGRQRRAARRGAPSLRAAAAARALRRFPLGTACFLLGRVGRLRLGRRRFRLLLATFAAAATASALRPDLFARCRGGRRCDYWFGLGSALCGRVFLALLAPEELQQKKSPSRARALASPGCGRSARCGYK